MLAGEAPKAAVAAHLSATVVALPKRAGGVRPVACGSVLRRLAARGACLALKEDIATAVGPYQFAVGVAGGCEKVVLVAVLVHVIKARLVERTHRFPGVARRGEARPSDAVTAFAPDTAVPTDLLDFIIEARVFDGTESVRRHALETAHVHRVLCMGDGAAVNRFKLIAIALKH